MALFEFVQHSQPVSLALAQVDPLLFHEAALPASRKADISTLHKADILTLRLQISQIR
jgi:hypothetical protein